MDFSDNLQAAYRYKKDDARLFEYYLSVGSQEKSQLNQGIKK